MDPGAPVDVPLTASAPIDEVILSRGSVRLLDRTKSVSLEMFRTSMLAATRGIDVPHVVAVHAVDGMAPGIYRWPVAEPVRTGDVRDELYVLALEQGLAQEAAFVTIGTTDVSAIDDRRYREAQLAAGLVEGRLHLLAYALDASACGMTFTDHRIADVVGERVDGLLLTCVGIPEYRSTAGGAPGAPTEVRLITPRSS